MYSFNGEERKLLVRMGFDIQPYDADARRHTACLGEVALTKNLSHGSRTPYIVTTKALRREFSNSWDGFYAAAFFAAMLSTKATKEASK